MTRQHRDKRYTYHEAISMLLDFEFWLLETYGLHTKPADGHAVVCAPKPGSLVEMYRIAVRESVTSGVAAVDRVLHSGSKAEKVAAGKDITQRGES